MGGRRALHRDEVCFNASLLLMGKKKTMGFLPTIPIWLTTHTHCKCPAWFGSWVTVIGVDEYFLRTTKKFISQSNFDSATFNDSSVGGSRIQSLGQVHSPPIHPCTHIRVLAQ